MTDLTLALRALLEKSSDTDLLREMVGFTAQRLMELEAECLTGAPYGKRSEERVNQRNGFMDELEIDVLAYMGFPKEHRAKLHSTNPIERLNGEIKRRTDVVGIFLNEGAIRRLVVAILLEQNDEWAVQRGRYMTLETMAGLSDDPIIKLPVVAA